MIYFWSDPHIYHTNVIKYCNRPYSSVEEMNESLVLNYNSVVTPEDIVYCMGDFSMAARPVETFTPRLMGKKFLVPGNHDFVHSYHKKSRNPENRKKWVEFYERAGWTVLPEQTTLDIPGVANFNLSHLPYEGDWDATQDKYLKHRLKDDGKILLCGHVHEKWKTKFTPKGTLMINCGVDVWGYKPVSLTEIEALLNSNTNCKDCGKITVPGAGSARCQSCWDDRCGN